MSGVKPIRICVATATLQLDINLSWSALLPNYGRKATLCILVAPAGSSMKLKSDQSCVECVDPWQPKQSMEWGDSNTP